MRLCSGKEEPTLSLPCCQLFSHDFSQKQYVEKIVMASSLGGME